MCGIVAVWQRDGANVDAATLATATRRLRHRGPDGRGCLVLSSRSDERKPFLVREGQRPDRCAECGHGWTIPRPTTRAMTRLNRRVYDQAAFIDDYLVTCAPYLRNAYRRGLERLGRVVAPSGEPLLDVGCGFGYFLSLARGAGYDVGGIELAPVLAAEAGRRCGVDVWPGSLLKHPFQPGSFAVVTLWDVLEHCADARLVVDRMRDLLRPGGVMLIRVPDFSFASAGLPASFVEPFVDEVFPLDFGYHGAHFSRASLDLIVAAGGLEVIDRWPSRVDEYTPKDRDVYRETVDWAEELGIACEQNVICRRKAGG